MQARHRGWCHRFSRFSKQTGCVIQRIFGSMASQLVSLTCTLPRFALNCVIPFVELVEKTRSMSMRNNVKQILLACPITMVVIVAVSVLGAGAKSSWKQFSANHVSFNYPSDWQKPVSKTVAAFPLESPQDKPDGVAPAHEEITIAPGAKPKTAATDKTRDSSMVENAELKVYIFPTTEPKSTSESFKKRYPVVASAVRALLPILKDSKTTPKETPTLPWQDASSPFEVKRTQLKFANGKAQRFLAEYLIEPDVIDNARLIYTAQGLTNDGKWYVSIVAPISTKTLPNKSDISKWPEDRYKKFSSEFKSYGEKVGAKLEKLPASSFSPDVATLDTLVQSLLVR